MPIMAEYDEIGNSLIKISETKGIRFNLSLKACMIRNN